METTKNSSSEGLSKISIAIVIAVVIVVAGLAFYFGGQKNSALIDREDIKITKQENFYGISGKILEINDDSIIIETTALPYGGFNPKIGDKWVWTVFISNNTEVFKFGVDERKVAEGNLEHMTLIASTPEILKAGDSVTVTSNNDMKTQFASNEKYIRATKIKVY